jgi:hypothetical protein
MVKVGMLLYDFMENVGTGDERKLTVEVELAIDIFDINPAKALPLGGKLVPVAPNR